MARDNLLIGRKPGKPIIIIIIIIIAFVAAVGISFWQLSNSVGNKIIRSNIQAMEELAQHDLNSIENSIILRLDNMEGVARSLSQKQFEDADDLLLSLKDAAMDIPSATKVSLLDSEGSNFLSNGVVQKNSYLTEVCAGKTERFVVRLNTSVKYSENVHEVIFEAIPIDITVDGYHFEWMFCQFPIDTLEKELKITSYGGEGYSSVIDYSGNYVIKVAKNHNFMSYESFFRDMKDAIIDGFDDVTELFSDDSESKAVTYRLNGQQYIMVINDIDIADWHFISTVPVSVFDAQTKDITSTFITLLIILIAVLALVLLLILRQRKQQVDLQISEAASKSKTEFLFNMSHDIRTPMNAILGYTDAAIKHQDDPKRVKESLEKTKIAGGHLLNLINDILEMSRIEAGKLEISEDPMDVRKLIQGVEQMSSSLAIEKSIEFKTEIGEISNLYVYSDELHVNEVLINLLSNAFKYTPEGGKVNFKAEQIGYTEDEKAMFRFTVSDNGIGMSEEFQQHLFEAFSREKSSTVSKQQGAGLGLSIVKRIVDMIGGIIRVQSKLHEGSTFTVEVPMRVMNNEEIAQYEDENRPLVVTADQFSFEQKKVLLVEDNEMNREIATEILEEVGLIIDTAEDGEFAVKAVTEKGTDYYDFILMDIQMPVMDGYEATKHIRALPGGNNITIIALSANAFEEDKQKSLDAGMNAHVAKPIDVKVLFDTMQRMMNS